jgi:hypothetical protein
MHETVRNRQVPQTFGFRRGVVLVGLLASVVAALPWARSALAFVAQLRSGPPPGGWTLSAFVVGGATCIATVSVATLALSGMATVLAGPQAAGKIALARLAPLGYRRLVLAACGCAIALPVASTPGEAAEHDRPAATAPDFPSLAGLPLPDLPVTGTHVSPRTVRIMVGDSLWEIAERLAGASTPPAEIAADVAQLHALNRQLIGPDPDLILPGTELTTPGGNR